MKQKCSTAKTIFIAIGFVSVIVLGYVISTTALIIPLFSHSRTHSQNGNVSNVIEDFDGVSVAGTNGTGTWYGPNLMPPTNKANISATYDARKSTWINRKYNVFCSDCPSCPTKEYNQSETDTKTFSVK